MRILMLVAIVCLAIALLGAIAAIDSVNILAWFIGGMLAWALDSVTGYVVPVRRP